MTNKKLLIGLLAFVLVFAMTVVGCDNDSDDPDNGNDGDGSKPGVTPGKSDAEFNSIPEMAAWLSAQPANTAATAYNVKLNVSDLGNGYGDGTQKALSSNRTKYVRLDLSGNTFTSIGNYDFIACSSLTSVKSSGR